jgi:hypothetical protein
MRITSVRFRPFCFAKVLSKLRSASSRVTVVICFLRCVGSLPTFCSFSAIPSTSYRFLRSPRTKFQADIYDFVFWRTTPTRSSPEVPVVSSKKDLPRFITPWKLPPSACRFCPQRCSSSSCMSR